MGRTPRPTHTAATMPRVLVPMLGDRGHRRLRVGRSRSPARTGDDPVVAAASSPTKLSSDGTSIQPSPGAPAPRSRPRELELGARTRAPRHRRRAFRCPSRHLQPTGRRRGRCPSVWPDPRTRTAIPALLLRWCQPPDGALRSITGKHDVPANAAPVVARGRARSPQAPDNGANPIGWTAMLNRLGLGHRLVERADFDAA